ncbi:Eco57I restriction-modification methylase domain-containing protein [Aquilutibacter rugosus]|uniref:Eco57I restriction-modification methylase domain-containing protein n=1 Tax=Aquilutibacter rugosus TaxID=3115820 RepID=UPI002F3EA188
MNYDLFEPTSDLTTASQNYANAADSGRGSIFTRQEVVDFILDLIGYTEDKKLFDAKILEPSCGHGDFIRPIIGRLVRSYLAHGGDLTQAGAELSLAIRAVEVHHPSYENSKWAAITELMTHGVPNEVATALAEEWIVCDDFLLAHLPVEFDFVAGNPPYVRQELIPNPLLEAYRARFRTLYDRADLYVLFYERCLGLLSAGGQLGFICTDRWTKNKYGGPLRELISKNYSLRIFIDLVGVAAFNVNVMTYPAITIIQRARATSSTITRVTYKPSLDKPNLDELATMLTGTAPQDHPDVVEFRNVVNGSEPWILHHADRFELVKNLEAKFPTLEVAKCKIGIGVATGNDNAYIAPFEELNVEESRKLPLVRTQDLTGGMISWQGMAVLNPFESNGKLVDLNSYPLFASYLASKENAIRARYVSKKNPAGWYRTIDRIYPELANKPKLLIPDIKGDAHVVYEEGKFYPHHNLYYITSEEWDLRALQAVLLSGIARLFVSTYSTMMRGGYLRFQAQYLRRIRLPYWSDVPRHLKNALRKAAIENDVEAANRATAELYGLSETEQVIVNRT